MATTRAATTHVLVIGALLASFSSAALAEEERPEATPYRPTVSTPAALSAPGWFEGESGGLQAYSRDAAAIPGHRASLPYTIKYAFTDDWGLRVGGEALVGTRGSDGGHRVDFGDTGFTAKRRFAIDDDSAFGLEIGALLPTARAGLHLGSGKPDWSANGIYSVDFAGWHADANLVGTRLGARQEGVARWQQLGAVAVSHPLARRWTVAAEWSGTRQHGDPGTAQVLGALAYALRRDCVLDFGFAHGLDRATPTWQAFAGITVVIGKL